MWEPSRVFYGRVSYNVLDLELGIRPQKPAMLCSYTARDALDETETFLQVVRQNATQAYIRYKTQYDKKAKTCQLREPE